MSMHPAELNLGEILQMNRNGLIGALLGLNQYTAVRMDPDTLRNLPTPKLRQALMDMRRHVQARGY